MMLIGVMEQCWSFVTVTHLMYQLAAGDQPPANKMSFKPPTLTEEDEHSKHMPDYLKCESCQAIAYQIQSEFIKAEDKIKNKKMPLSESEILEVTENVCQNGFEMYGIKGIMDTNHLSGPGLETDKMAGIVQMGGKWPQRLRSMCSMYLGEVGEDKLYDIFKSDKQSMAEFLCQSKNTRIRGHCSQYKSTTEDL